MILRKQSGTSSLPSKETLLRLNLLPQTVLPNSNAPLWFYGDSEQQSFARGGTRFQIGARTSYAWVYNTKSTCPVISVPKEAHLASRKERLVQKVMPAPNSTAGYCCPGSMVSVGQICNPLLPKREPRPRVDPLDP